MRITATDPFQQAGASSTDPTIVLPARRILVTESRILTVRVNQDFHDELDFAPDRVFLTTTIRQRHRLLWRGRLTLRRRPVADTFVPAAGTHYSGVTSEGESISFDIGPNGKTVQRVSTTISSVDPSYCPSAFLGGSALFPDGTFNSFSQGTGYDSISGLFATDGTAHGSLGHADRANGCSYAVSFTARATP